MSKQKVAYVIGSGTAGATSAWLLKQLGWHVEVFEVRDYVSGNCHDYRCPTTGVMVHTHGPHAIHTSNDLVWKWLNTFASFHPIAVEVWARTEVGTIPIPYNDVSSCVLGRVLTDDEIREHIFRPYSEKMWSVALEELPPAILNRLQFRREGRDSRFTLYTHQGVPTDGFVAMFHEILAGIPVHTSVPKDTWRELKGKCDLLVYTGKVDDYFDLAHGRLRYRSLRIEHEIAKPTPYIQLNECNYHNKWCRAIDHHHWYGTKTDKTVITREYPVEHVDGENFPYYPIVFGTALEQAKLYEDMMKGEPNTLFVGRTATYRYLTIDQTILQVVNAMKSKGIPAIL